MANKKKEKVAAYTSKIVCLKTFSYMLENLVNLELLWYNYSIDY